MNDDRLYYAGLFLHSIISRGRLSFKQIEERIPYVLMLADRLIECEKATPLKRVKRKPVGRQKGKT